MIKAMENLTEVKKLHHQVQVNIFNILFDYKVIELSSCCSESKIPLYFFSEEYTFYTNEIPVEIAPFISSVNRLLETGFLLLLSNPETGCLYLIKTEEYSNLTENEKRIWKVLLGQSISELLIKKFTFSF
jgi:hypothetical protein